MSLEQAILELTAAVTANTAALTAAKTTAAKASPKAATPQSAPTAPAATSPAPATAPTAQASVSVPTAAAAAPATAPHAGGTTPQLHPIPAHLEQAAAELTKLVNSPARGGRPAGEKLLAKFGVKKLTELAPAKISEFTAEAKAIGVAPAAPAAAPSAADLIS